MIVDNIAEMVFYFFALKWDKFDLLNVLDKELSQEQIDLCKLNWECFQMFNNNDFRFIEHTKNALIKSILWYEFHQSEDYEKLAIIKKYIDPVEEGFQEIQDFLAENEKEILGNPEF